MIEADFRHLLRDAGFKVTEDIKAKYLRGILKLFRDEPLLFSLLQNEAVLRLFSNAQLRKGRAYTLAQLQQIAAPAAPDILFSQYMAIMLSGHLFQRVYALSCEVCGIEKHIPPQTLSKSLSCEGCLSPLSVPLSLDFSYVLNPLCRVAFNNGMLTVLLMLDDFSQYCENLRFQSHMMVKDRRYTGDIDLIVDCDGALFMVECKDSLRAKGTVVKLKTQLFQLTRIAVASGAMPVFATLHDGEIPQRILEIVNDQHIVLQTREMLL